MSYFLNAPFVIKTLAICIFVTAFCSMTALLAVSSDKRFITDPLEPRLAELAGPKAVNCGRVAIKEDPQSATSCALHSFRAKKPFRVRYDLHGIDSSVAMGLVFSKGKLVQFWYDDYSGAGSHPDDKHFWFWTCSRPYAVHVNKFGRAVCSDRFAKN